MLNIQFFIEKASEKGMSKSALGRAAWPGLDSSAAYSRIKRLEGKNAYKPQALKHEDVVALCFALGLDVARTIWESEQSDKSTSRQPGQSS